MNRRVLIGLGAVVVLVAGWWLARSSAPSSPMAGLEPAAVLERGSRRAAATAVEVEWSSATPEPGETTAAATPAQASSPPLTRWYVEGKVTCPAAVDWSKGCVRIWCGREWLVTQPLDVPLEPDGSFVAELVGMRSVPETPPERPDQANLLHSAVVADRVDIDYTRALAGVDSQGAPERRVRIEIQARPIAVLRGKLVDAEGGPPGSPRALLVEVGGEGRLGRSIAWGNTLRDGTFTITTEAPVDGCLLTDAQDSAPRLQRLPVLGPGEHDLGEIALERGATITGVAKPCGSETTVHAVAQDAESTWIGWLGWLDGHLVKTEGQAALTSDGSFRISGLAAGPYSLFVRCEDESAGRDKCRVVRDGPNPDVVVAPAGGIDLARAVGYLHLALRSEGRPLPGATVTVRSDTGNEAEVLAWAQPDDGGHACLGLEPGRAYRIEVRSKSAVAAERVVKGPADGMEIEEVIDLRALPVGSVILLVQDPEGERPMNELDVLVVDLADHSLLAQETIHGVEQRFVLANVSVGRHCVVALNLDGSRYGAALVDVIAGKTIPVDLTLRPYGLLRFEPELPKPVPARVLLRDAAGNPLSYAGLGHAASLPGLPAQVWDVPLLLYVQEGELVIELEDEDLEPSSFRVRIEADKTVKLAPLLRER